MNIFVLHLDPEVAAQMACDKHVVKMILETAQMLCAVGASKGHAMPYKATHTKHPCTIWAGASRANWSWLVKHGMALCLEYTKRYDKIHKSQAVIEHCRDMKINFNYQELTPFAQAMPQQYKSKCAVSAYRDYYRGEKARFAKWKTKTPSWW
jgi:hypothetical protein